jgi:3',5'-cyclic AMP phosphodiesterase CpdA
MDHRLQDAGSWIEGNAQRIADDVAKVVRQPALPFGVFIAITGDIAQHARSGEFDQACAFLSALRADLANHRLPVPASHVIAVPGNHDVVVPPSECERGHIEGAGFDKFGLFKLFLLQATDYADFARRFSAGKPYVLADYLVGHERVLFIGLNSCWSCQATGSEAGGPSQMRSEDLADIGDALDATYKDTRCRIALMHHPLIPRLEAGKVGGLAEWEGVVKWLTCNQVHLLLLGHLHRETYDRLISTQPDSDLLLRHTGHSFFGEARSGEEYYSYEVLIIEPGESDGDVLTTYDRRFSFSRPKPQPADVSLEAGRHYPGVLAGRAETPPQPSPRDVFVFCRPQGKVRVVAHCPRAKFNDDSSMVGQLPPGDEVWAALMHLLQCQATQGGEIVRFLPIGDESGIRVDPDYFDADAVFVVDSPGVNPYTKYVMDLYPSYVRGSKLSYSVEELDSGREHVWRWDNEAPGYRSNKDGLERPSYVDRFTDYLAVIRLPNFLRGGDRGGVIWVIAGSHTKGSVNGARLFRESWLDGFWRDVRPEDDVEPFFEALYEVPAQLTRCSDFAYDKLQLKHRCTLIEKPRHGPSDDIDMDLARALADPEEWPRIGLKTVHFDPVSACNLHCPGCIEVFAKGMGTYLPLSQCIALFRQFSDLGCKDLRFYGGEPTLHPDFPALVELGAACGFQMQVVTNGTQLLQPDTYQAIARNWRQLEVRVSLDANSASVYARHHGLAPTDAAFDEVVEGVKSLLKGHVRVGVSCLIDENSERSEVEGFYSRWTHEYPVDYVALRPATDPKGRVLLRPDDDVMAYLRELGDARNVKLPSWLDLRSWEPANQSVDSDICYSQLYRVVVSPGRTPLGGTRMDSLRDGVKASPTERIWVSRCAYRRYRDGMGEEMPVGFFADWWREGRVHGARSIVPREQCCDIVCNRIVANRLVQAIVAGST